jgi:hypothetical protein
VPDIDLGPQLKPTEDTIDFLERHAPALPDGEYEVRVQQLVTADKVTALNASRSLKFVVAGPRFVLAPNEVDGMFPPPGASGDFASVLPHVLLRRASLPWERSAVEGARETTPWLALLVLHEKELRASNLVPAKELLKPTTQGASFAILENEPADDKDQTAQVIEIDTALAALLLPTVEELSLLAGVREVNGNDARALVVANRLPRPGRNLVHLVSLEHQYRGSGSIERHGTIREPGALGLQLRGKSRGPPRCLAQEPHHR